MILRPVRPASPCGPPITKFPVGFISSLLSALSKLKDDNTGSTTYLDTASAISLLLIHLKKGNFRGFATKREEGVAKALA